jgi:hypothetical protein
MFRPDKSWAFSPSAGGRSGRAFSEAIKMMDVVYLLTGVAVLGAFSAFAVFLRRV